MQIDEQTIRSLLADQHIPEGMISHGNGTIGRGLFIERLTSGINHILETGQQAQYLKEELEGLKEKYDENCAELDMEMARLVNQCQHPSWVESEKDGLSLVICNICGGIIEEEITGGI
jgi:hypothetical protein